MISAFYLRLGNPAMARKLIVTITKCRRWSILFIENTTKEYNPWSAIYFLQLIFLYPTQKGKPFLATRPNSQSKVRGFDKQDNNDLSGFNPPRWSKTFWDQPFIAQVIQFPRMPILHSIQFWKDFPVSWKRNDFKN